MVRYLGRGKSPQISTLTGSHTTGKSKDRSELKNVLKRELEAERETEAMFTELSNYKNKHAVRRMMNILNVVLYLAIIGALLPQAFYFIWITIVDPDFLLPWKIRDSFLLFSAIGNLSVVVLSASSIIIVRTLGKRLDRYDQIIDAGMKDMDIIRRKFKGIGKDIDDIYPGIDRLTTFYKDNQDNIHDALDMMKDVMPFVRIIKIRYGKRLKQIDKLTDEEKEIVLDMILDDVFNRGK